MNLGDEVEEFLVVPREFGWMGQFDWLNSGQASMVGSGLQHTNCSVRSCKVPFEVGDSAGIVRVVFLRFI
jgi:hypothetical protein